MHHANQSSGNYVTWNVQVGFVRPHKPLSFNRDNIVRSKPEKGIHPQKHRSSKRRANKNVRYPSPCFIIDEDQLLRDCFHFVCLRSITTPTQAIERRFLSGERRILPGQGREHPSPHHDSGAGLPGQRARQSGKRLHAEALRGGLRGYQSGYRRR